MSGFNLVSAVQRGERRIVAVVLGGASAGARDAKMRSLIESKTQLASVKRTAPRITEIADAAPMPAPVVQAEKPAPIAQPEKPVRVAAAGAPVPAKPQSGRSAPRAAEPQPVAAPAADQPAPGSTEPIRPLLVKTLSVKAAAIRTASTSMFAPDPISARSALVAAATIEAPKPEARAETLPPPPPGARPGVLGVLPGKDTGRDNSNDAAKEAPVRIVTASAALAPPAPAPVREPAKEPTREIAVKPVPAAPAPVAPAPIAIAAVAPPAPARVEAPAISSSKPRSGWIVQVGAFEEVSEAKEKIAEARAKAASILKGAEAYTEIFSKANKRYYRARFAGLKEGSAEQACKELQKSKMACFAVRN
jgi:D-alanyl-D-alanine carboxypeptidase